MPIIFPTKACNLRCSHCMRGDYPEGDIDLDMMRDFMYNMENLEGFTFHSLTGGEPTLHKNFDELLQVFKYMRHKLSIVTNGQLKSAMESLVKHKALVEFVNISFDSPLKEYNDKVRGKGTFDKAMESLLFLQKNGITVVPVFVAHSHNGHLIDEIFNFVKKHQTAGAVIIGLQTIEKSIKNGLKSTENSAKALLRYYELRHKDPRIVFNSRSHIGYINPEWSGTFCTVMEHTLREAVLTPDGNVWTCCDFVDISYHDIPSENTWGVSNPVLGNVKVDSVETLLERKKVHANRIINQRLIDAAAGKLKDGREIFCDNCKFYHFHRNS